MTTRLGISPTDWITLARYVSGEARPDERASLDARAAADPAFAQLMSESLVGWTVAGATPMQRDKQAAWTSIAERSRGTAGYPNAPGRGRFKAQPLRQGVSTRQTIRQGIWPVMATVMLIALVTMVGWNAGVSHLNLRMANSTSTYSTANGQRATYTLPDGGTVALNVGSRLDVPGDYATGHRTVRLVGEAMFSVVHTTGTPFAVVTGRDTVQVLGTNFVVRRYPTDSLTTVAVREGKVAVHAMVVTAAQQVAIGRAGVGRIQPADPAQFSFATGVLVLDDVRFPEATVALGRWYDADIRLGDPALATRHIAGEFAAGTIADLAEYLSSMFNVRVVRSRRVLTLFPR